VFGGELWVESTRGRGTTIIAKAKLEGVKGIGTYTIAENSNWGTLWKVPTGT
jgi:hypothetical protein